MRVPGLLRGVVGAIAVATVCEVLTLRPVLAQPAQAGQAAQSPQAVQAVQPRADLALPLGNPTRDAATASTLPALVDYLPAPRSRPAGSCTAAPLRTAAELGAIDETRQPLLALLRQWGQRHLGAAAAGEGCLDWTLIVRGWQQVAGQPATGVLAVADLNRLQEERMAHFSRYRADLAAWQQERAAAAMAPAPPRPVDLPARLLAPQGPDALADLGNAPARVETMQLPLLMALECALAEGLEQGRLCRAALATGRLKGWEASAAHYHVAWFYSERNDLARALEHTSAGLAADPRYGSLYTLRASVLSQAGEQALALQEVDTAIGLLQNKPKSLSSAYSVRAVIVGRSGNLRGAYEDNEQALRLDPGNKQALNNRSVIESRR